MTTKEPQTTSFELSKELNKLQKINYRDADSYLYWVTDEESDSYSLLTFDEINVWHDSLKRPIYPAYALSEILEMLSWEILCIIGEKDCGYTRPIIDCKLDFFKDLTNNGNAYTFSYKGAVSEFTHQNPAEAAGMLLKWCIENEYIKMN